MHAILIWFDYLPYALPGCCGNTEAHTPGFDHFAACSVTFDNCFVVDRRGDSGADLVETLRRLREGGVSVRVLAVHPTRLVRLLNQQVDPNAGNALTVEMLDDDDQLMQQISAAAGDAASEGAETRAVAVLSLPGVVTAEGEVIEELLESADRMMDRLALVPTGGQTLLLVTAAAGSLEGGTPHALHERLIHVPLLGRLGPPIEFGVHCSSLIAHSDVTGALQSWAKLSMAETPVEEAVPTAALLEELRGRPRDARARLMVRGPGDAVGVRTRQWYLITRWDGKDDPGSLTQAAETAALYRKPEDLWESLDVASQSPAVVNELVAMLRGPGGKSGDGTQKAPIIEKDFD